jgi:hypothetical protein
MNATIETEQMIVTGDKSFVDAGSPTNLFATFLKTMAIQDTSMPSSEKPATCLSETRSPNATDLVTSRLFGRAMVSSRLCSWTALRRPSLISLRSAATAAQVVRLRAPTGQMPVTSGTTPRLSFLLERTETSNQTMQPTARVYASFLC